MKANMNTPQRNAITIQMISAGATGSFHHTRCSGGWIAMTGLRSPGHRDLGQLHHPPEDVEDGRDGDAEKEEQKRVVEHPLHERNALRNRTAGRRGALALCHLTTPRACQDRK